MCVLSAPSVVDDHCVSSRVRRCWRGLLERRKDPNLPAQRIVVEVDGAPEDLVLRLDPLALLRHQLAHVDPHGFCKPSGSRLLTLPSWSAPSGDAASWSTLPSSAQLASVVSPNDRSSAPAPYAGASRAASPGRLSCPVPHTPASTCPALRPDEDCTARVARQPPDSASYTAPRTVWPSAGLAGARATRSVTRTTAGHRKRSRDAALLACPRSAAQRPIGTAAAEASGGIPQAGHGATVSRDRRPEHPEWRTWPPLHTTRHGAHGHGGSDECHFGVGSPVHL